MKYSIASILFLIIYTLSLGQTINSQESEIKFKIGSVGFSKVKGDFSNLKGSIRFDENNLSESSFNVSIDASTVNTGNEKRDEHLKNEDFFEVNTYPIIRFVSSEVKETESGYVAIGKLTMKNTSKTIQIYFDSRNEGKNIVLDGEFEINRLDYLVGEGQSKILIRDKVKLFITCVLSK